MTQAERTFEIEMPEGRRIRGRVVTPSLYPPPHPFTAIVYGHTSHLDWGYYPELSRRLATAGIASIRFNYSGDGLASDLHTFSDEALFARTGYGWELEDLAAVNAFATQQPDLDATRSAVLGHSRGGGMAAIHAAEAGSYRALVLWAAIDAVLQFSPERLRAWRRDGEIFVHHWTANRRVRKDIRVLDYAELHSARLDVLAACGRLTCPTLIVQGTVDRAIAMTAAHRLHAACPDGRATLAVIQGGDHVFGAQHPLDAIAPTLETTLGTTVTWLQRHLRRAPVAPPAP